MAVGVKGVPPTLAWGTLEPKAPVAGAPQYVMDWIQALIRRELDRERCPGRCGQSGLWRREWRGSPRSGSYSPTRAR